MYERLKYAEIVDMFPALGLTPLIDSNRAHFLRTMLTRMPEFYRPEEALERGVEDYLNWRMGLEETGSEHLLSSGHEVYQQAREAASERFTEQTGKDLVSVLRSILVETVTDTEADVLPIDPESVRTYQYLGYESEDEFISGIVDEMTDLLYRRHITNKQIMRFRSAVDFAEYAYEHSAQPRRKSGEKYLCHVLRTAWYYLTAEDFYGRVTQENGDLIVSNLITALFHDLLEDVEAARVYTNSDNSYIFIDEAFKGGSSDNGGATSGEKDVTGTFIAEGFGFRLRPDEVAILRALVAGDDEIYLQDVVSLDINGRAQLIKQNDRLDNILTYWHQRKWDSVMRKLYKTYTATAVYGWESQMRNERANSAAEVIEYLIRGSNTAEIFGVSLIGYGMFQTAVERVRRIMLERFYAEYDFELSEPVANIAYSGRLSERKGIPATELPRRLSLEGVAERYRQEMTHGTGDLEFRPFSYQDLKESYIDEAVQLFAERFPHRPWYPGGRYDSWDRLRDFEFGVRGLKHDLRQILR